MAATAAAAAAATATNIGKKAALYSDEFTSAVGNALNTAAKKVSNTANSVTGTAKSVASSLTTTPMSGLMKGVELVFYLAAGALFLFLFLVGIHYTVTPVFSFMPGDEGVIPLATGGEKQMAFIASVATQQPCGFKNLYGINVAFAFDLFITNDFSGTIPRVVFYKAPAPIQMVENDTEAALSAKYSQSSVVLFVDALKNDLKVMIQTKNPQTNAMDHKIVTAIENVPIRKPVRIGIVVFKKFVEVYEDGTLVRTVTGDTDLLNDEAPNLEIFGPPSAVTRSVKTSRITYWPYVISPKMLRIDAAEVANPNWFA